MPQWINYSDIYVTKTVLSVGLIFFFYRLPSIYLPISPTLGPMLVRMIRMVICLVYVISTKDLIMDIPLCLRKMKKKGNVENYYITTFYNEDYKKDNSLSVGGRIHCSAALTIFLSYLGSH
jgi:hypothetical protein